MESEGREDQGPPQIYSWGGIFIGPPTRHMSDWRLKLHFQFGIAICSAPVQVSLFWLYRRGFWGYERRWGENNKFKTPRYF